MFLDRWLHKSSSRKESPSLFPLGQWTAPESLNNHGPADADELKETLQRLFVQMHRFRLKQQALPMSVYFMPEAMEDYARLIEEDKQEQIEFHADRMAVLDCQTKGYYTLQGKKHVVITIRTRMVTWLESITTLRCIAGNQHTEQFMTVAFDLQKTDHSPAQHQAACPCCGALVNVLESTQCPFCGHLSAMAAGNWRIAAAKVEKHG